MLRGAGSGGTRSRAYRGVTVRVGLQGDAGYQGVQEQAILDRFFGPDENAPLRVIR